MPLAPGPSVRNAESVPHWDVGDVPPFSGPGETPPRSADGCTPGEHPRLARSEGPDGPGAPPLGPAGPAGPRDFVGRPCAPPRRVPMPVGDVGRSGIGRSLRHPAPPATGGLSTDLTRAVPPPAPGRAHRILLLGARPTAVGARTAHPAFDAEAIRRDFPILRERVNGRPLVWLDNAATTQKPQAVIDRLSYFYEHENSNIHRAAHDAGGARDRRLRGRAGEGARASSTRRRRARSSSCAARPRASTWSRRAGAGGTSRAGDEIVITWLEHHANIVPWQQLCAEKGARLRVAPVDDSGQVILDEYEKLLGDRRRGWSSFTQVSNALGTVDAGARDDRDGAPPRRARAARRRPGGLAHAASTCRRSTATSMSSPATRSSRRRASASSTARPRCSTRCRPGRAAAT